MDFETTFTKPLIAKLDAGDIKGGDEFAKLIASYYAKTVTTGIPGQGKVPATLPAPGLNPTTPPPFAIGASPFKSNSSRERAMYKVLSTYFLIKEVQLDDKQIAQLKQTYKNAVEQVRTTKQQIELLRVEFFELKAQLESLPTLFVDIIDGIKILVQERKDQLSNLQLQLEQARVDLNLTEVDFRNLLSEEYRIIDSLKNLKVDSVEAVRTTISTINDAIRLAERSQLVRATTSEQTVKAYLKQFIARFAKELLRITKIVDSPQDFVSFVNEIARDRRDLQRFLKAIQRFDLIERYVVPRLKKIKIRIEQKIKDIANRIKPRIQNILRKIEKFVQDQLKKLKDSKAAALFNDAVDSVKKFKDDLGKKVEKLQKKADRYKELFKTSLQIAERSVTLYLKLQEEFEAIKAEIEAIQRKAIEREKQFQEAITRARETKLNVGGGTDDYLKSIGRQVPPESVQLGSDLQQAFSAADTINRTGNEFQRKTQALQADSDKAVKQQLAVYLNSMGLGDLVEQITVIITQTKGDISDFKNLFERKKSTYTKYAKEINKLYADIQKLVNDVDKVVKEDFPKKNPDKKDKDKKEATDESLLPDFKIPEQVKSKWSLKNLFLKVKNYIQPIIEKVVSWIKKKIKKAVDYVKSKFEKEMKNLELFLLTWKPKPSSELDDETRKLQEEDRKLKAEQRKKQIEDGIKLTSYILKAGKGLSTLTLSLVGGNYSYIGNELAINNMLDGIYSARKHNKDDVTIASLNDEQKLLKERFKVLKAVELIVLAVIEIINEVKSTDFVKEWTDYYNEVVKNPVETQTAELVKTIKDLIENPTLDPKTIVDATDKIGLNLIQLRSVTTRLIELERKYLRRSKKVVEELLSTGFADISDLKEEGWIKKLKALKAHLDKNPSYLQKLFEYLGDLLADFEAFARKVITKQLDRIKSWLKRQLENWRIRNQEEIEKWRERALSVDNFIFCNILGIAARVFWTGATWNGETGSNHVVYNIGRFKPIKQKLLEGASVFIPEVAKSFEGQLNQMRGVVIPPANTGISPLSFKGYGNPTVA